MARVRVDRDAMRELLSSPRGPVARELVRRAIRVQNEAKRLCPVDNGELRASITHELVEGRVLHARVGTNVKYAMFVHEGTGVYGPRRRPIVPVRAKVLRWPVRGQRPRTRTRGGSRTIRPVAFVFAARSRGTPPRPFLRDALRAAR